MATGEAAEHMAGSGAARKTLFSSEWKGNVRERQSAAFRRSISQSRLPTGEGGLSAPSRG